jgi:hypothetical protein
MLEEPAAEETRAICRVCGYAARVEHPSQCPVCGAGSEEFDPLDVAALRAAADHEGDAAETGFDGHKLGWTLEARRVLQQLPAGYLRRRVKAMVEKQARTRRLPAITAEVAEPFVGPELAALDQGAGPHRAPLGIEAHTGPHVSPRRLPWSDEAEERLARIPAGFLRNLASEQIERLALALHAPEVEILHAEAGIAEARARMRERLDGDASGAAGEGSPAGETAGAATPGCPVHAGSGPGEGAHPGAANPHRGGSPKAPHGKTDYDRGLNEVSAPMVDMLGRRLTSAEAVSLGRGDAGE